MNRILFCSLALIEDRQDLQDCQDSILQILSILSKFLISDNVYSVHIHNQRSTTGSAVISPLHTTDDAMSQPLVLRGPRPYSHVPSSLRP